MTDSGLIKFTADYTIANAVDLEVGNSEDENELDGTHSFFIPGDEVATKYGYELAGGELTLDGQLDVNIHQTGGELEGTQTITGIYNWLGGDWDAAVDGESTTISSSGTLVVRLAGGYTAYYYNRDIINHGSVYWTDGNLNTNANGSFTNHGYFYDQLDDNQSFNGGAGFNNDGTYQKTGSGNTTFHVPFSNSSPETVDVRDGILILSGGGTNADEGAMIVRNSGLIKFNSTYVIDDASELDTASLDGTNSFTLPDEGSTSINYGYQLYGGELTLDGDLDVNFLQTGGELDGTHTINGVYDWAGGDWDANADGESTTIDSDGTLVIRPGGGYTAYFYNRDIINDGTVFWTDANLNTNAEGSFTNNGDFYDQLDSNQSFNGGSGFTNDGTYEKTGSGTTTFHAPFSNTSPTTLDVGNGTLLLNGGGTNFEDGAMLVRDSGLIKFNSTYVIEDASDLDTDSLDGTHNLTLPDPDDTTVNYGYKLYGGELTMDGTLNVNFLQTGGELDGTQVIKGVYDWAGGDWDANVDGESTTINSGGTLVIRPGGGYTAYFYNRDIINNGTVYWTDANLNTNAEGSFTNYGNFNDLLDDNQSFNGGSGFSNGGTYLKTGEGTTTFNSEFDNYSPSTVDVRAGNLVLSGGGTNTSSGAVKVRDSGLITFNSTYSIDDASKLDTLSLDGTHSFTLPDEDETTVDYGYHLAGGELTLDGVLNVNLLQSGGELDGTHTISAVYDWAGGDWDANADGETTTIDSTGTLVIRPGGGYTAYFYNRDIVNQGTVYWEDANLNTNANGSFTNDGNFYDVLDDNQSFNGGTGFTNNSIYLKTGEGDTTFNVAFENADYSTLQVREGHRYIEWRRKQCSLLRPSLFKITVWLISEMISRSPMPPC